jgi:hypothetical protein
VLLQTDVGRALHHTILTAPRRSMNGPLASMLVDSPRMPADSRSLVPAADN